MHIGLGLELSQKLLVALNYLHQQCPHPRIGAVHFLVDRYTAVRRSLCVLYEPVDFRVVHIVYCSSVHRTQRPYG
jgi:hypothetical protein